MKRQKGVVVLLVGGFALTLGTFVEGRRFGADPGFNGSIASSGLTCAECHSFSSGGSGSVQIFGAPAVYVANETYELSVRVSDPDQFGAGFQLSVEDQKGNRAGVMNITDDVHTRYSGFSQRWMTHTSDGVDDSVLAWSDNGGAYDYTMSWTAPAVDMGLITFFVAGNAVNNDGQNNGDHVYLAQVSATGDGLDCNAIGRFKAKCKAGKFTVKATIKSTLSEGSIVSTTLDGARLQDVTINQRGVGKAVWRDAAEGEHEACVVGCPELCSTAVCVP